MTPPTRVLRAEPVAPSARAAAQLSKAQDSPRGHADLAMEQRTAGPASAAATTRPLRARSAPVPALAELRSRIATDPQRWTWRLGPGDTRAVDAPLLDWLTRLEAAAGVELDDAAALAGLANPGLLTLHLLRDAQLQGSVQFEPDALRIVIPGAAPQTRRAGLAPPTARAFEVELTQLAR